jgi:hypothetical protein
MNMDEKILARIRRKLTLDVDFMKDCQSYDNMDNLRWTPPAGFATREEIRLRVSTDAHDILKTAINLFDTHNPKWQILPRGPADADAAEEIERWLEWQMMIADQQGDKPSSAERLKHAAKYGRIACQLDFLPAWVPEGTEAYKDALARPFCVTVHCPANVRYERGKYGLRWVAVVTNIPAADAIDHWDAYRNDVTYGKEIESAIAKVEKLLEEDDEARVIYVDYTDKEKRWCFCYLHKGEDVDTGLEIPEDGVIEFIDGENRLGFINWAISEAASTPLLYSLHKGGLWENQNFLDTIADTTIIRRGWFPIFKHKSMGGKDMDVNFTGSEAVVELDQAAGEDVEIMVPPPLDPGIRELMDRNSQKAASATGLKGLQNMDVTGNVQYAAVQAQLQVSRSVLDPYATCYEHNAVELGKLAFMWIKKTGISVTAQRRATKSTDKNKVAGQKITLNPEKFDPRSMIILCELTTTNKGDELQRMNMFSQAKQMGLPVPNSEILERMGWGNADALKEDWLKEQMEQIALAMYQKQKDAELTMQVQQAQMQMQMAAQQAQMQQQQAAMQGQTPAPEGPPGMVPPDQGGGAQMMPGGIGNDVNQGGIPAAMSSPQETQTQTRRP